MLKSNYLSIGLVLLLISFCSHAAIDIYQFGSPEKEKRFQELAYELRCPKCQNQNLADSNSEIAKDLRTKIQQMLEADKSNAEIIDYMVARYGDFVLYAPRVKPQTYLLWYGPALLLLFGLLVIVWIIRHRNKQQTQTKQQPSSLSNAEAKQLDALLSHKKGNK